MARRICTIVENNSLKSKHLRELKENFRTYGYLRQPKTIENNNLTFISTFNPNNPKICDLVKSDVNTLVENNVNDFKNVRLNSCKTTASKSKTNFNKFLIYN